MSAFTLDEQFKDRWGDVAEVKASADACVSLTLNDPYRACTHAYTPTQARELAALLVKAADLADSTNKKEN